MRSHVVAWPGDTPRACGSMAFCARKASVQPGLLDSVAVSQPQEVRGQLGGTFLFKLFKLLKSDYFTCR